MQEKKSFADAKKAFDEAKASDQSLTRPLLITSESPGVKIARAQESMKRLFR